MFVLSYDNMPNNTEEIQDVRVQNAPLNRNIELFLIGTSRLEIYDLFGFQELNKYLEDLQLLALGARFSDLGISERREKCAPRLIELSAAGTYSFANKWDLEYGEVARNSIALLQLRGVMRADSSASSPGVDSLVNSLYQAYNSEKIVGVIVETNSGGGESIAGNILKGAIKDRNKPVIGFAHLAASAAYRALSGGDEIIASGEASEFGSIGTMISLDQKLLSEYRERFADFYGSDAPGKNSAFRKAMGGDYAEIQKIVDDKTIEFQNDIRASRPLRGSESAIKQTLDGSIFPAMDAKKRGLIDGIGNLQYAVKRVNALLSKY